MNHLRHLESTMKCSLIFLCRKLRTQNQNSSVQDQSDLESPEEVSGSWFSLTLTSVISSSFSEKWLNFIFTSCFNRLRSLDRRQETEGHITSTGVSTWRGSTPSMVKSELTSFTNESQTRDMGRVYKRKITFDRTYIFHFGTRRFKGGQLGH